ncbi:MAG: hypothetical protein J6K18_04155 [Bacilli bacterium]|nr:hypothetical protein [Bacilli bacterium]
MQKQYKLKDLIESFVVLALSIIAVVLGVLLFAGVLKLGKDIIVSSNVFAFIILLLGLIAGGTATRVIVLYYNQNTKEKK